MQRRILLVLLIIFVSLGSVYSQESQWFEGRPVARIEFEGLASVSRNELLGLVRPYIGLPYNDSLSWDIQGKLYALDYFDLIIPEIQPADESQNSVLLVFQVQEKPLVKKIIFKGNSKARRGELLDAVLVKEGDLLNPGTLKIDEQAIKDLYLEKGFVDAQVRAEYTLDKVLNQVDIVFTIIESSQTKISEILFVGNDKYVADNTLRNLMKTKAQSLFNKGLFVETKLQEDLKAIERYYADQGFIEMSITDVQRELVFDKEENLNKMVITIVINEGTAWTYGGISFTGNKIYTTEELKKLVTLTPGSTFNQTKFQLDYQSIVDLYLENGYIFNNFTYEEKRDEENRTVFFEVSIVERDRAHIENIIIRGNTKTKNYVITREFPLEEGEVFSKAKILEGMMNLYNLQFFETVEPNPYPGSQDGLMDLVVDVSEGKTSDITFGLSFSGGQDFPVSGQISWNDRNFLGRGQTFGIDLTGSPDRVTSSVKFTEPRILGLRWAGGMDLSYSWARTRFIRQDADLNGIPDPYNTWDEYEAVASVPADYQMEHQSHDISSGLNTGYTWVTRLGRLGISGGLRFSWQYVVYDDSVYTPFSRTIRENLKKWQYSDSVHLRLYWDTRDLQYDPTKGFILSETLTYAGIMELGNRNYIKSVSRLNVAQKIFDIPLKDNTKSFKAVISMNTAFNAIFDKKWRDLKSDIVDTDGFTVDGMFIGRGWPTSSDRYKYLWDNSLELTFPIVPNILSYDIFLDAVGAWQSNQIIHQKFGLGEQWRFSLGTGLRFANPQFPIGIYVVKRFQWQNGRVSWWPDRDASNNRLDTNYEFKKSGMDLVIAFNLDIY